jgi:hypothetical protein
LEEASEKSFFCHLTAEAASDAAAPQFGGTPTVVYINYDQKTVIPLTRK